MISLLKTEWLKLKSYRSFWVMMGMFSLLFLLANYFIAQFNLEIKGSNTATEQVISDYYAFPYVWQMTAYVGGYFLLIPAILLITLIANEFTFRTHRQNIIDGWSRSQFITAKLIIVLLLALFSMLMVMVTAIVIGYVHYDASVQQNLFSKSIYIVYFFVQSVAYLLIAFVITIFLKRSGASIVAYLLLVAVLGKIIGLLMNKYLHNTGYFFPSNAADNLIQNPMLELTKGSGLFEVPFDASSFVVACIVYSLLLAGFIYWRFNRVDL
ncbi:MAG TPA: ABC transporter permease [Chitinophagales bacterium]|nr:ABC transporter permease [Chitinophagales bacterium]